MIIPIDKTYMLKTFNRISLLGFAAIAISCGNSETTVEETAGSNAANAMTYTAEQALSQQGVDALLWARTSAEADYLYRQTYAYAKQKLALKIDKEAGEGMSPAVILDLDETVLDNSEYELNLIANGGVISSDSWNAWVAQAAAPALPGAVAFCNWAKENGVEVFYVSNRSIDYIDETIQNLADLGLPNADREYVWLMEGESDKTKRRAHVTNSFNVLLYLGDNLRDFDDVFKGREMNYGKNLVEDMEADLLNSFVLFPNPMYGEWTRAFEGRDAEETVLKKLGWFDRMNTMGQ